MTRNRHPLGLVLLGLALFGQGCGDGEPSAASKAAKSRAADRPSAPGTAALKRPEPAPLRRLGPGVHSETATAPGGGTLRYGISVPDGLDPKAPAPLVVALHYGGEVTPFYGRGMIDSLFGPALADLGAVVVAPDALDGGDWATPQNEQAVVWLTRSVLKSYPVDPKRVLLTGYSMGGQGTWYLAGRHQGLFTAAMPVSGEPRGDVQDWKIPLCVIHSQADEILPLEPTRKSVERLRSKGANVELVVLDRPTHYQIGEFIAPLKEAVAWLRGAWK